MRIYLISLLLLLAFGCAAQESAAPDGGAVQDTDSVAIRLSDIGGTVEHYTYDADGVAVRYFAVEGSDGVVRTAFDACEVCYGAGKGYSQDGTDVVCNNCGLRFRIDDLGTENQGRGCWPAYLPHGVNGDEIVIKKSDLEAGAYLFS